METALNTAPALRLKASLYPFTLLELDTLDLVAIETDLQQRLKQAPDLFRQAPVVVQLPAQPISIEQGRALIQLLKRLEFIPIGLRSAVSESQALANALELPLLKESSAKENQSQNKKPAKVAQNPPLIIKQPVRSGQQILNAEGDIIVFGHVGQGAEVLASGNIYVYGTLNGRALAGIHGNEQATITCQKLQSELFAIAGHYQVSEDMDAEHWQRGAHIALTDGRLIIESV